MSLQFIIGNSGAGKSFRAYQRVIREAAAHPEKNVLCDRSGAVHDADTENTCRDASAERNPEY